MWARSSTGGGNSTVFVPLHSGSIDVQAGGLVLGGGSFSGTSTLTGDVGLGGGLTQSIAVRRLSVRDDWCW